MTLEVGELSARLGLDATGFDRGLDGIDTGIGGIRSKLDTLASRARVVGTRMSTFLTVPLLAAGTAASGTARDLREEISKVDTVFGDSAGVIQDWSRTTADSLGLSRLESLRSAGTFGNLFTQLEFGSRQGSDMSRAMVQLAADFGSFHNADITSVLEAQTAAFRGEYDALQRYVPTINAAAVEQQALTMTGKASADQLTAQERALATYTYMLENAGPALGDFARTADEAANSERRAQARAEDLAATFGQRLLPLRERIVGFASGILERFNNLSPGMQNLIIGVLGVIAAAGPLITMFGALVPVIAAVASPVGLVVAAIGGLIAGLVYAYNTSDDFRAVVQGVVDWFQTEAVPVIEAAAAGIVEAFGDVQAWVDRNWPAIQEAIGHVVEAIRWVIERNLESIRMAWQMWGDDIMRVVSGAVRFVQGVIEAVMHVINGDWGKAWDSMRKAVSGVWGAIQGIIGAAVELVQELISEAWSKLTASTAAAWDGIVSAVSSAIGDVIGWMRTLPGRAVAAVGNVAGLLVQKGRDLVLGLKNGGIGAAMTVWEFLRGLPGQLRSAIGDLGGLLYNAGRDLIGGLINGITSRIGAVRDTLGGLTNSLTSWKGPEDVDRVLLTPAGQMIIDGLIAGFDDRRGAVQASLASITDMIARAGGDIALGINTNTPRGLGIAAHTATGGSRVEELLAELIRKVDGVRPIDVRMEALTDKTARNIGAMAGAQLAMSGGT